jgi:hypothetical protein
MRHCRPVLEGAHRHNVPPLTASLRVSAWSGTVLPLNRHRHDIHRYGLVTDRSRPVTRQPVVVSLVAPPGGRASVVLVSSWLDMDVALAAALLSKYCPERRTSR